VGVGKLTLLVENDDISASEVDGVGGTQARHCKEAQTAVSFQIRDVAFTLAER
jgi:hypothetical protein